MKFLMLVSIMFITLIFGTVVYGQESTPTPMPTVNPATELKTAKEILNNVVGKDEQGGNKTFADVLEKGLDLFAVVATSMAEMVKKIAPEVFEIMVRQQYAAAISNILYWLFIPLVFLMYPPAIRKFKFGKQSGDVSLLKNKDNSNNEDFRVFSSYLSYTLCVLMSLFSIYYISESVMMLINPKYYAIKDMLLMIQGK